MKICGRCHGQSNSAKHMKCREKHAAEMNRWYHRIKHEDPKRFAAVRQKLRENTNRLRREKPEEHKLRTLRHKMNNYAQHLFIKTKHRAALKKLKFTITLRWVENRLAKNICEITGIQFQTNGLLTPASHPFQPSIDRKDPAKGYTPQNSRVVCVIYNYAKHTYSHEDVLKLAKGLLK